MPLLWKKEKIAQLSGLVCDLRSRRRRSSLVVQTGFPTSLADLVVKNRTRLKKPSSSSKKKKISGEDCSPISTCSAVTSSSEAPVVELPLQDGSRCEIDEVFGPISTRSAVPSSSEAPVVEFPLQDGSKCEIDEAFGQSELSCSGSEEFRDFVDVSGSRWFSVIVKVFFVVVLALGSKEIAVGITASAFILFFLEFMGKRLSFCWRDCAGLLNLNRVDVIRFSESDFGSCDSTRRSGFEPCDGDSVKVEITRNQEVRGTDEIQVVESDLDLFEDRRRSECPSEEAKSEVLTVADDGGLIKVKKGRNRKLGKAILKKFIPKKLHRSKDVKICEEEKLDSISEASEFREGVKGVEEEDEEEEICSSLSCNVTTPVNLEEIALTRKSTFTKIEWNLGYLVAFMIVLLGLVGGRGLALLLTVAWFLLMRSLEAVWRNLKNVYERTLLWIGFLNLGKRDLVL